MARSSPADVIVVVDDSATARAAIGGILRKAGYLVEEASTGAQGLNLALMRNPMLMVLDVQLEDIHGIEVCRRIKSDPATRRIPVLQVSGVHRSSEDRALGLEQGADGYLSKPVDARELLATVRALIRLREALKREEEAAAGWRATFEAIQDGVCLVDSSGLVARANRAMCRLARVDPSQITGMPLEQVLVAALGDQACQITNEPAAPRRSWELQSSGRWYRVTRDLLMAGPIPTGAVFIVADCTDEIRAKEAEQRLREESRFRALVQELPVGVAVRQDSRFTYANASFAQLLGAPSCRELVGKHQREVVLDDSVVRRPEGPREGNSEHRRLLRTDGTAVTALVTEVPMELDGQQSTLVIAIDETERTEMESRMALAERLAAVGTVAAGVAHEVNNPLTYMLMNADAAIDFMQRLQAALKTNGASRSPQCEAVVRDAAQIARAMLDVRDGARRIQAIIRDLRAFTRPFPDEDQTSEFEAVLDSVLRICSPQVRHRARVRLDVPPLPALAIEEVRLAQVLLNLVVNAAQAIPDPDPKKHEISILARVHPMLPDRVIIDVQDTGIGIPAALLERIFEPFFSTKQDQGTGLGLSISRDIVRRAGGEIRVSSTPGRGTCFQIELPSVPVRSDSELVPRRLSTPRPPAGAPARILVIDDDPLTLDAIQLTLREHFEVATASSSADALDQLRAGARFEAILCDLMMPTGSGMELHRIVSDLAPDQASCMLFMTGGAYTHEAHAFYQRMPDRFIQKPFDPEAIEKFVASAIRARHREVVLAEPAV